eukprot:CCRYP_008236-RA/>CCRYP_008236-RA protein AED:0.36 eAED:0.40 QI:0/0/0/1/0/0/2/0/357
MPLALFPEHVREQYGLDEHAKNGFAYLELRGAIYGLPQAGARANKLLRKLLTPHGYYKVVHTPGLWRHVTRPISLTLVEDYFGVKYVGREHAEHLIRVLKEYFTMSINWDGAIYCGIQLNWNYDNKTPDISMPNYIHKALHMGRQHKIRYQQIILTPLDAAGLKRIQQIFGSLLFYAQAVDNIVLLSLSAIASEQASPTQLTNKLCKLHLDYCASHPSVVVHFKASNMILNRHSDASYLSETNTRSRIAGHFFLGSVLIDKQPIQLNGAIYIFCGILKFGVTSAAEAKLGALFLNCKEGKILRLVLQELGHAQPPTPTHCDNKMATGIANDTAKNEEITIDGNAFLLGDGSSEPSHF